MNRFLASVGSIFLLSGSTELMDIPEPEQERLIFKYVESELDVLLEHALAQDEVNQNNVKCLALNIYHEARGESYLGKLAVSHVVMNRLESDVYPDTICDVVQQSYKDKNGNPILNKCQFSWYCDGVSDIPTNKESWEDSLQIANNVYYEQNHLKDYTDPTDGAIMYHATSTNPYWSYVYERTTIIGNHVFYR